MSYNQKALKLDMNNKPVPQLYNPGIDDFEALQGRGGASAIVAGRFWQVGAGATTTSIPMLTSSGLSVSLSASTQSQMVGSKIDIVLGSTLAEAVVTAVSTSGTLTLDSALPSAPAQGTTFLLIPPEQTQLTGSNIQDQQSSYVPGMLYDGSKFNIKRGNISGTLLASAARTATTLAPVQTNYNARGVVITLNVTAASSTGGLTLLLITQDPVSSTAYQINTSPTAVTATGIKRYVLYPCASGGQVDQTTGIPLPRTWYAQVNHGDSSSYTYSVGYSLIL